MSARRFIGFFFIALGSLAVGGANGQGADGPVDPYTVYVATEGVYARCGPGSDYYRTDPLHAGDPLEVYLETDDQWLGIRPPEGSFCWVPADQVQLSPSGRSAVVSDRQAVAWIGTHLGRARKYRWQVRLAVGEPLVILGEDPRDEEDSDGGETWYRVVPPPGEFRWVHRSQVAGSRDEVASNLLAQQHAPTKEPRRAAAGASEEGDSLASSLQQSILALIETSEPIGSGVVPPGRRGGEAPAVRSPRGGRTTASAEQTHLAGPVQLREIQATAPAGDTAAVDDEAAWIGTQRPLRSPHPGPVQTASGEWATLQGDGVRPASHGAAAVGPSRGAYDLGLSPENAAADLSAASLSDLQLVFSRHLAYLGTAEQVEPVRRRALTILETSADSVDRGRARVLIERVETYQRVARTRGGGAADFGPPDASAVVPATATSPVLAGAPRRSGAPILSGIGLAPPQIPSTAAGAPPATSGSPAAAAASLGAPAPAAPASGDSASGGEPTGADESPRGGGFDRSGFLVQVYSARSDAPPFALTDSTGRTLIYVTPAPGVNLRRYLNQEVGLRGHTGHLRGLDTPNLMAEQVVRLRR